MLHRSDGQRLTRHARLKCNRGHPCDNCTKRGDTASCTYAMPGSRKKSSSTSSNSTPDDMQNRIDRLESLVLSLMTNGAQAPGAAAAQAAITSSRSNSLGASMDQPLDVDGEDMIKEEGEGDDSDINEVANGIGVMKVDNGKAIFASDAHWYAILADVGTLLYRSFMHCLLQFSLLFYLQPLPLFHRFDAGKTCLL